MNDKKKSIEALSEMLGELDGDILSEAYLVDDGEKLRKLKDAEEKGRKAPMLRKIAVIAACLAVLAVLLLMPALLRDNDHQPMGDNGNIYDPWGEAGEAGLVEINSLDKLNYYSAKKIITDAANRSMSLPKMNKLSAVGEPRITFLSDAKDGKMDGEEIYYYELGRNEIFTVSSVTFFRAEIKSKEGFLASKLGLGEVEVVITESDLETMITFKRGDNYYSCLLNGTTQNKLDFSTHKYIDGFCIVKNLEQDNFAFSVILGDDGQVLDIDCRFSESYSSTGGLYPDLIVPIPNSTCTVKESYSFTMSELEAYFNSSSEGERESVTREADATEEGLT